MELSSREGRWRWREPRRVQEKGGGGGAVLSRGGAGPSQLDNSCLFGHCHCDFVPHSY